ncbi:MAG TPA: DegT/DnrJ/EryC1/StrS family aminotransferase [Dehalococcoidia bacterium]|nr:DegT/DnrJ/EryC1/StrS family aminotransferase [Dehalococcoidia bacterium]
MIRIAEPRIGEAEREAVLAVLASGRLSNGPVTRDFETAFAREVSHTPEAVAVSSGTAALHVALLAHGIGPGDEVITTAFSFQATANMILATGARPVFVDVRDDCNIDPERIEAAITSRTRAVLPVHLYGRLCDMQPLCDLASRRGLALIEDAAQAHGASAGGRYAGSFGAGCFSLYATKNLAAGEGGVVTTGDPALARRLRRLRAHGEDDRYESVEVGYNYRLTEVSAALALAQIGRLAELNELRRRNAVYLSQRLERLSLPETPIEPASHVWNQYTVRVPDGRDQLRAFLHERDIEAMVYYPMTLPSQKLYRDLGYDPSSFPVAHRLANEVLSLPVHPGLSFDDLDQIVDAVNAWTREHAASRTAGR